MELKNIKYKDIISDISLSIKDGTITSFIGPNGSAKTTLLKIISSNLEPSFGEIKIGKKSKVAIVNQYLDTDFFYDTVYKELQMYLEKNNYSKEKYNERIMDSIKMVGLNINYLKRDPLTLSSSEMRVLMIAKALSINPNILILDEPTVGMTYIEKNNLIKIIKTIKRRYKKTIIVASQDIEFIHLISDYIYVLKNGKIILEGNKFDIFKEVKLLKSNGLNVPKIIQFEHLVINSKKIRIGYRDDVNDLIKDILRNKE